MCHMPIVSLWTILGQVQSSSARAIRLMLHGTMYLGIIAAAWLGPIRFPGPMKGLATAESTMAATPESGKNMGSGGA